VTVPSADLPAYLLVSHGSRDLRPYQAMQRLALALRDRLRLQHTAPEDCEWFGRRGRRDPKPVVEPLVGIATLELARKSLAEQIRAFGDRAAASRYQAVRVVPLFLLPGVHVMEDIPREVADAQAQSRLPIQLCPYLGSHPGLVHALAHRDAAPDAVRLLVAHGSRYPQANQPIEAIAQQLNFDAAYWAIAPSLESKITTFAHQGWHTVDILPYFLFGGSITDAIAQQVHTLRHQFPQMTLHLAQPLEFMPALLDLVLDVMIQPSAIDPAFPTCHSS
jgi:sirohydrochlorin cobaltochelatase